MSRKLFELNGVSYFSIVLKNIPKNMVLETQKYLKDLMDSPGRMSSIVSNASNCLRISYSSDDKDSKRVLVVKNNLSWLMTNKTGLFYVDYSEYKLESIIAAFNSGNFTAFTLHKKLSVETYSVF